MAPAVVPMIEAKRADVSKIEVRALTICDQAKAIKIESHADAQLAASFLNEIVNPLIREGDDLFDPMIAAAYSTHQLALATKKKAVGGLPFAKAAIRSELARWQQVLDDQARVERLRLEQMARDEEAARIEKELEAVEASGSWPEDAAAEVRAIIEAPRAVSLPVIAPAPKIDGVSTRDVYTAEVTNFREFFRAIGEGRVPVTLAEPNQGALNRMAGALKDGFNVPGCRVLKSKSVSSSKRF